MKLKINSTFFIMIVLFYTISAGTVFADDMTQPKKEVKPNLIGYIGQVHVTKSDPIKIEEETKVQGGMFAYERSRHKQVEKILSSEAIVAAKHDKAAVEASLALANL